MSDEISLYFIDFALDKRYLAALYTFPYQPRAIFMVMMNSQLIFMNNDNISFVWLQTSFTTIQNFFFIDCSSIFCFILLKFASFFLPFFQ